MQNDNDLYANSIYVIRYIDCAITASILFMRVSSTTSFESVAWQRPTPGANFIRWEPREESRGRSVSSMRRCYHLCERRIPAIKHPRVSSRTHRIVISFQESTSHFHILARLYRIRVTRLQLKTLKTPSLSADPCHEALFSCLHLHRDAISRLALQSLSPSLG